MMTIGGTLVRPDNDAVPTWDDVGYGLARINRYAGATTQPWTVLQHSIACWTYAQNVRWPAIAQLHCLIHDAGEAVTGDITNAWKSPDMKALQDELDRRIWDAYQIPHPGGMVRAMVRFADLAVLAAEVRLVGTPELRTRMAEWLGVDPTYVDDDADAAVQYARGLTLEASRSGQMFVKIVDRAITKARV